MACRVYVPASPASCMTVTQANRHRRKIASERFGRTWTTRAIDEPPLNLWIRETAEDAAGRILASLAADVPPVELTFTAIGHQDTYFRSLYLRAAPSAQLQALQEAGRQTFALDRLPPAPHLSLLYSDMTGEHKDPLIRDLGVSLPLAVYFDAVELWVRDPRGIDSWHRAARVPLPGRCRRAVNRGQDRYLTDA
jgi:hypothetical protein